MGIWCFVYNITINLRWVCQHTKKKCIHFSPEFKCGKHVVHEYNDFEKWISSETEEKQSLMRKTNMKILTTVYNIKWERLLHRKSFESVADSSGETFTRKTSKQM